MNVPFWIFILAFYGQYWAPGPLVNFDEVGDGLNLGDEPALQPFIDGIIDWNAGHGDLQIPTLPEAGERTVSEGPEPGERVYLPNNVRLNDIPEGYIPAGMIGLSQIAFRNLPRLTDQVRVIFETLAFLFIVCAIIGGLRIARYSGENLDAIVRPLMAAAGIALLPTLANMLLWVVDQLADSVILSLYPESLAPEAGDPGNNLYSSTRLASQFYYFSVSSQGSPRAEEESLSQSLLEGALRLPPNSEFDISHLIRQLNRHTKLSRGGLSALGREVSALDPEQREVLSAEVRLAHQKFIEREGDGGTVIGRWMTRRAADYAQEVEAAFAKQGIEFGSSGLVEKFTGVSIEEMSYALFGRIFQMIFVFCLWVSSAFIVIGDTLRFVAVHLGLVLAPLAVGALATKTFFQSGFHYIMALVAILCWPLFWAVGHVATAALFDALVVTVSQTVATTVEGTLEAMIDDYRVTAVVFSTLQTILPGMWVQLSLAVLTTWVLLGLVILGWTVAVVTLTPFLSHHFLTRGGNFFGSLIGQGLDVSAKFAGGAMALGAGGPISGTGGGDSLPGSGSTAGAGTVLTGVSSAAQTAAKTSFQGFQKGLMADNPSAYMKEGNDFNSRQIALLQMDNRLPPRN